MTTQFPLQTISGTSKYGQSTAVSFDGSTIAFSDPYYSSGDNYGIVQVFNNVCGQFSQKGQDITFTTNNQFGSSINLNSDGTILVVGAISLVSIYNYNTSTNEWDLLQTISDGTGDFGQNVKMTKDGKYICYGDTHDADNYANIYVYVFDNNTNQYTTFSGSSFSFSLNNIGPITDYYTNIDLGWDGQNPNTLKVVFGNPPTAQAILYSYDGTTSFVENHVFSIIVFQWGRFVSMFPDGTKIAVNGHYNNPNVYNTTTYENIGSPINIVGKSITFFGETNFGLLVSDPTYNTHRGRVLLYNFDNDTQDWIKDESFFLEGISNYSSLGRWGVGVDKNATIITVGTERNYAFTLIRGFIDNIVPEQSLCFTGYVIESNTLTANTSMISDLNGPLSFTYQWQKSNDNTTFEDITNETFETFTIPWDQSYVGKYIRLTVVSTNSLGTTTNYISPSLEILNKQNATIGTLTFSGDVQEGSTLSVNTSGISDFEGDLTFTYQWQLSDDNNTFEDITDARFETFTIPSDQSYVGKYIRVTAVSTDSYRGTTLHESAGEIISNVAFSATGTLYISNQISTHYASIYNSDFKDDLPITQGFVENFTPPNWIESGQSTTRNRILSIGSSSYLSDVGNSAWIGFRFGRKLYQEFEAISNGYYTITFDLIRRQGNVLYAPNFSVYINNELKFNEMVINSTIEQRTIQWLNTDSTVRIEFATTDPINEDKTAFISNVSVSFVVISPLFREGGKAYGIVNDISDKEGDLNFTYQWQLSDTQNFSSPNDNINNANEYILSIPADNSYLDKYLRLLVVATDPFGGQTSFESLSYQVKSIDNHPSTGTLDISGNVQEGSTLTANTTGISDPDGALTFTYQWQLSNDNSTFTNIEGATSNTFNIPLGQNYNEKYIRVTAESTDPLGGTTLHESTGQQIANVDDVPIGILTISGYVKEGETLTADTSGISNPDGDLTFSTYQWQLSSNNSTFENITNATSNTFDIPSDQNYVGKYIRVTAVSTDPYGGTTLHESIGRQIINDNPPTGTLTISGVVKEGSTLTADTSGILDPDGDLTFTNYQWQLSSDNSTFTNIEGATSNTFVIPYDSSFVDKYIRVTAVSTDSLGGTTLHESTGEQIANVDDVPIGILTISGYVKEGETLTADTSGISDPDGDLTFSTYQWQLSSNNSTFENITNATSNTFDIPSDQNYVGKYIRVTAVSTDSLGGTTLHESTGEQIANVDDVPIGILTISGYVKEGETLTADTSGISDPDGDLTFTYQWQLSSNNSTFENITNATSNTFNIPSDGSYFGKYIRVTAVSTDSLGGISPQTSSASQIKHFNHQIISTEFPLQTINGTSQYGRFTATSFDGSTVAFSDPYYSSGDNYGLVQVFDNNRGQFTQKGQDITITTNSEFGSSIDLNSDGTILLVGCNLFMNVYVYFPDINDWVLKNTISEDTITSGNYGKNAKMTNDAKYICTTSWVSFTLTMYVYIYDTNNYTSFTGSSFTVPDSYNVPIQSIDITWDEQNSNTLKIVIGRITHNMFYLFTYNDGTSSFDIKGKTTELAGGDWGRAIAISHDGTKVAGGGSSANYITVYDITNPELIEPIGQHLSSTCGSVRFSGGTNPSLIMSDGLSKGKVKLFYYDANTDYWNIDNSYTFEGDTEGDRMGQYSVSVDETASIIVAGSASGNYAKSTVTIIDTLTFSGDLKEGGTLTADTSGISDFEGDLTFTYQWQLSENNSTFENITNATSNTFNIPSDQNYVGKYIRVTAVSTDPYGGTTLHESIGRQIINDNPPTGTLTISGDVKEGETLTANTSDIDDPDGTLTFTYQWQLSSDNNTTFEDITNATSNTFVIPYDSSFVDKYIRVTAVSTDPFGGTNSHTSSASQIQDFTTGLESDTFTGNDFSNANFSNRTETLKNKTFKNVTLYNTNFKNSDLSGVKFHSDDSDSRIDMKNADLSGTTMNNTTIENANLDGADMQNATLSGTTNLKNIIFNNVQLTGLNSSSIIFTECTFSGITFTDVDFSNSEFTNCEFSNCDLANANFLGATFTGLITDNIISSWSQRGYDIDGEAANDESGASVSLSGDGNRVAIGADYNDGNNGTDSGHVRIFEWNGSEWTQLGSDIDGEAGNDYSGYSVSLSSNGNRVAIGADYNDGNNGTDSGHVRIFEWNGSEWTQLGSDIDGEAATDRSGISVSLSTDGSCVAIGASRNDGNVINSGHVRIYQWNGSDAWTQMGDDIDGEVPWDYSGDSVSLSGNGSIVAIGASNNDANGNQTGHVRIYQWNGTAWTQMGSDIDGEAAWDYSGNSVSLSTDGSRVAIGAYANDGNGSNSGHVRIYDWNGSSWNQAGSDIDGEAANDESGYSVSLSSDGNRVAVGAKYNDGNGSNSGHVRIYEWNSQSATWVQVGADIDGEAVDDESGYSVSLSGDGNHVAIGARNNDGNGSNSGHVRIYKNREVLLPDDYSILNGHIIGPHVHLQEVNFTGEILRGKNLKGVKLRGANLLGTTIDNTTIEDADLEGADMRNATLTETTNFKNVSLKNVKLTGVTTTGTIFNNVDFTGAQF